jgi:hypothetical protein
MRQNYDNEQKIKNIFIYKACNKLKDRGTLVMQNVTLLSHININMHPLLSPGAVPIYCGMVLACLPVI